MSYIPENIRHLVERENLKKDAFGRLFGLKKHAISNYIYKKSNPSIALLQKICTKYDILLDDFVNKDISLGDVRPAINYEKRGVPYFDVDFVGGFDKLIEDKTIKPLFYIDFEPYNNAEYWINITGNSMSDKVNQGDIGAIRLIKNWNEILYGEIYAIVAKEMRTIKYIRKADDEKNYFQLVPHNTRNFDEQKIPKENIKYIFAFLGAIKRFF